ncbi:phage baseplate assembly protein domain-containing protein [Methylobacterium sp. D48H]
MSTLRSGGDDSARRSYLGVSRATIIEADDKPKMQEVTVRARFGEQFSNVEAWGHYGISYVPLPPDKDGEAEVLIAYLGGSPDHPVVIGVADRRHRPKDMKPGDVAFHDHRGSLSTFTKDGITHRTPLTITHNTVDKDGKVTSSVVQDPSGKVTITNKDGATIVMDGPNLTTKPGAGGKHIMDGDVSVKGALDASKAITALSMLAGGLPVKTS